MSARAIAGPTMTALDAALESVEQVSELVESAGAEDTAYPPWEECRRQLDQVRGALVMLEIPGARLLVEECIAVIEALEAGEVLSREAAVDGLFYALLFLPRTIRRTRDTGDEVAEALLPTINGLRGLRRTVPIPEYDFCDLTELEPALDTLEADGEPAELPAAESLRQLRHMLQAGLLGLFKTPGATVHHRQVHRALDRLQRVSGDTVAGRWLRLAAWVTEPTQRIPGEADSSLRLLLSRLDLYIRGILMEPEPDLDRPPPPMVRQALLFYAQRHRQQQPELERVAEGLGLAARITPRERIEAEREAVSAPDGEVLGAVTRALREDMADIQSLIERIEQRNAVSDEEQERIGEQFNRLGHTLTLLGVSDQAAAIKREHTRLQSLAEDADEERRRERINQCADVLSECDAAISRLATTGSTVASERPARLQEASEQAIREGLVNLQHVRATLEYYNGDLDDGEPIAAALTPMDELRGTLAMLSLTRAAELVGRARALVSALDENPPPEPDEPDERLDVLADAIAAIEWHLEGLLEGVDSGEGPLEMAEASLDALEEPLPAD